MQNTESLQQFIFHQAAIIARLRQSKFEKKLTKTTYSNAYKILTVGGLLYIAIYWTFVFQHAYLLRYATNKIQTRYTYFSGIYKKNVAVWRHRTFNVGSVLTKIKTFYFYTNAINFFCNHFCDPLFGNFQNVLKLGVKYLINCLFFKCYNTQKRATSWRGSSVWQWKVTSSLQLPYFCEQIN